MPPGVLYARRRLFFRWFFGSIWRVITGVVITLIVYVIVDFLFYGGDVITAIEEIIDGF